MGASMSCNYNADSEAPHQNHNTDKSKRLKSRAERDANKRREEVNEPEEEKFQEERRPKLYIDFDSSTEEVHTPISFVSVKDPLLPEVISPSHFTPLSTPTARKRQDSEDKENQGEPGDRRENGDGNDKDPIKTYDFQSNKSQPWGAAVGFGAKPDKWKITRLTDGAQFHQRGVRKGWRVIKVNDIEVNEKNKDAVKTILRKGQACTITFDSRPDVPQKVNK